MYVSGKVCIRAGVGVYILEKGVIYMRMKRYNFHLPTEWDKELDEITKKIDIEIRKVNYYTHITKSDVIRMAIGMTYNLKKSFFFGSSETIIEIIKKLYQEKK